MNLKGSWLKVLFLSTLLSSKALAQAETTSTQETPSEPPTPTSTSYKLKDLTSGSTVTIDFSSSTAAPNPRRSDRGTHLTAHVIFHNGTKYSYYTQHVSPTDYYSDLSCPTVVAGKIPSSLFGQVGCKVSYSHNAVSTVATFPVNEGRRSYNDPTFSCGIISAVNQCPDIAPQTELPSEITLQQYKAIFGNYLISSHFTKREKKMVAVSGFSPCKVQIYTYGDSWDLDQVFSLNCNNFEHDKRVCQSLGRTPFVGYFKFCRFLGYTKSGGESFGNCREYGDHYTTSFKSEMCQSYLNNYHSNLYQEKYYDVEIK